MTTKDMNNLIAQFKVADAKVTQIENNGGLYLKEYATASTLEYDRALEAAQELHTKLEQLGIDPFA